MCGIVGIFDFKGTQGTVDGNLIEAMAETLHHRGPDDRGAYITQRIGLGFRRLSIIDLESGNQPMVNEDQTIVSVCNGEIFNFKELKAELQHKGHHFRTNCDVEVLVHLYEEYNTGFISRLNGQFAFAIYDTRNQSLLVARDQAGIAPLYYTLAEGQLIFGSAIKAILKHPAVTREVDLTGLDQVFSFPAVISPTTMFKNISSLKAGHYMVANGSGLHTAEYWDLVYPELTHAYPEKPDSYYIEALEERLLKSVSYRMLADVPVGYYLSGGLDSSLIAALVKHLYPNERHHAFSIGFEQKDIDERSYQQTMAQHVNAIHHESVFDWQHINHRFKEMILHAETPLKETYDTCSLALSALVRENGFKVILTGEGSDELFAGYLGYRFDHSRGSFELSSDMSGEDLERLMEAEESATLWGDRQLVYEVNQYPLREIKQALYSPAVRSRFHEFDSVRPNLVDQTKLHNRHILHKRSYLDFKLRLGDHLLADHGDRAAYANSVEARYPFLDSELLNFVTTIPPHLKLNGLEEKYLLKQVAHKYVAPQVIAREKFGFVAPGSPYLLKRGIEWLNDTLSFDRIKRQSYFDPHTVERLKSMYMQNGFKLNLPYDNDLLMIVISFGVFLDLFEMPNFS